MQNLITFAFVAFAPLYYLFQIMLGTKSTRSNPRASAAPARGVWVLLVATTGMYFVSLLTASRSWVYVLLVGSTVGPFVDLALGVYPDSGAGCHLAALLFFALSTPQPEGIGYLAMALACAALARGVAAFYKKNDYFFVGQH